MSRDNVDRSADVREHVEDMCYYLGRWAERDDTQPQPQVRQAANDAMDAIDAALRELYRVRETLVGETRQSDDANAARVDAMLDRKAAQ